MGPPPPPHKYMPAMETTAKDLTSPGRSEADHANGFMMVGDQSREDASSSTADLLTPKRRMRVGFWNVIKLFQSGRLAQLIREINNYNLAIMGITEARSRETKTEVGRNRLLVRETGQ